MVLVRELLNKEKLKDIWEDIYDDIYIYLTNEELIKKINTYLDGAIKIAEYKTENKNEKGFVEQLYKGKDERYYFLARGGCETIYAECHKWVYADEMCSRWTEGGVFFEIPESFVKLFKKQPSNILKYKIFSQNCDTPLQDLIFRRFDEDIMYINDISIEKLKYLQDVYGLNLIVKEK